MTARLLAVLLGAAAAGCSAAELGPLDRDPALAQVRATRVPLPLRLAVAPPRYHPVAPPEHAGPYAWPLAEVQNAAVAALQQAGSCARVRPVPMGRTADGAAMANAWDERDDLLLEIDLTRCESRYVGTNGWYVPNLIMWIELIVPSWFVADEQYVVHIEGVARLRAVATGREVWSGAINAEYGAALDDFERGMVLLGTLRVPGALGPQNWRAVGDRLHPWAERRWQVELVRESNAGLQQIAKTPEFADATRQTLALLVGCGRYYDASLVNLKFPDADVRAMRSWLAGAGVPARQVRVLVDEAATRQRILDGLQHFLATRARPADRVVIYFSGYAAPDGEGDAVLLPYDADAKRPGETGIRLADLRDAVAAIPDADVLLVLDAGLGGPAQTRWAACGLPAPDRERVLLSVEGLAARPRTAVLAACEPGEGAAELARQRRGLLTFSWLLAVARARDRNSDGRISVAEAFRDVRQAVQMHALLSGRTQNPRLFGDGAENGFELPQPAGGGA